MDSNASRWIVKVVRLAAWMAIGGLPASGFAIVTLDEIAGILATNGIVCDTQPIQQSAIDGLLHAVDPRARILASNEAALVENERAGLSVSLPAGASTGVTQTALAPRIPVQVPEFWPRQIAYLKINGLYAGAGTVVTSRLQMVSTGIVAGLILDLREAGGADLASVVEVGSRFQKSGVELFRVRDFRGQDQEVFTVTDGATFPLPLMVLVNESTTDAAELLAAVLRNAPRVMLIGAPTRGDAGLRTLIPLSDGRRLDLAVRQVTLAGNPGYRGQGGWHGQRLEPGGAGGQRHDVRRAAGLHT